MQIITHGVIIVKRIRPTFMAILTYVCGLHLNECLSFRIKDVDLVQYIAFMRSMYDNGYKRNYFVINREYRELFKWNL